MEQSGAWPGQSGMHKPISNICINAKLCINLVSLFLSLARIVCVRVNNTEHSFEAVTSAHLGPGIRGGLSRGAGGAPGGRGADPGPEGAPGSASGAPDPASCPCHVLCHSVSRVSQDPCHWVVMVSAARVHPTHDDDGDPTITWIILEIPGPRPGPGNIPSHSERGRGRLSARSQPPGPSQRQEEAQSPCRLSFPCRVSRCEETRGCVARVMCAARPHI